jgi:rod shape determining protein RodA
VNVGVNLRLLPVTGLTLPFISNGGSSLVSMLLELGWLRTSKCAARTKNSGKNPCKKKQECGNIGIR